MNGPARFETPLSGGVANAGAVVRVSDDEFGDSVRRPAGPHTATVHAFQRHLRATGVPEIAEPLGVDLEGREVLRFIDADPPSAEAAAWDIPPVHRDHWLLVQVANVQRRMHEAAASFVPAPGTPWSGDHYFPPGSSGVVVCHNDLCISNVLRSDGTVVGIIDFDYVRPVNRLFDIAVALRHWLPVMAVDDCPPSMADADRPGRFAAYCDELGVSAADRSAVLDLVRGFLLHAKGNVARLADQGIGGFRAMMDAGYAERNDRTVAWLDEQRVALLRAASL